MAERRVSWGQNIEYKIPAANSAYHVKVGGANITQTTETEARVGGADKKHPCDEKYYPTAVWAMLSVFVAIILFLIIAMILCWQSVWDAFPGTSKERVALVMLIFVNVLALVGIIVGVVLPKSRVETWEEVKCFTPQVSVEGPPPRP